MAEIPKTRVISIETQLNGMKYHRAYTSHGNKWANTDPQTYRWWDNVPRRSKHPLPTGHTSRELSFMIMNAELSAVKFTVPSTAQPGADPAFYLGGGVK
jgi:hypothetical protein